MVEKGSSNQSVDKMFSIIETMAFAGTPMRLNDIAEKSQVSASTAMRILNALISNGYAKQDPESFLYSLSYKFLWIGNSIQENLSLGQLMRPYLLEITRRTGISCALGVHSDDCLVYVDEVVAQAQMVRVHHYIGKPFPLYSTACGRVFLSQYPEKELNRYLTNESLAPITPKTLCTVESLTAEILAIKERGYAFNDEESLPGMRCLAFPVINAAGKIFAGVSLSGTTIQIHPENTPMLVSVVKEILNKMYEECKYILSHPSSINF